MLSDSNATFRTCFEYLIPSCDTVWRVMELLRWGPADGSGPLGPLKVLFSSEHTTSRFVLCEQPLPRVAPATDRTTSSYVPHCDSTKSECWGYRPVPPRGLSPLRLFLLGVLVTGRKTVTRTAVCKVIKHKQIVRLSHGVIKIQSHLSGRSEVQGHLCLHDELEASLECKSQKLLSPYSQAILLESKLT